jgi:predicted amidophosphoribosyltransferase
MKLFMTPEDVRDKAAEAIKSKLQPCQDCGKEISKRALACPNCGRRIAFGMVIFSAVFWAAIILAAFGAVVIALVQIINQSPR